MIKLVGWAARRLRVVLAGAVVLLTAGCGHFVDVRGDLASLEKAQPTATQPDLTFEKLAVPVDTYFWIDEKSPLVDFGPNDGKSYVKAFELPESTGYRIRIRSYSLRDGLLSAAMFFPIVTFLDADKKVISNSGAWSTTRGGLFSGELSEAIWLEYVDLITPQQPYRYIVLRTTRARIAQGGTASLAEPVQLAAGASYHYVPIYIPSGPSGPIPLAGSPVGYFGIKLEPPKT
jgi:hypothetical protein